MQDPINRHLGTIPQLCRAISSQLRHVSTIGKKLVKQQYLLYMSPQYGEVRPTSGCDRFVSLGHPGNFNGFRVSAALLHGTLVVGIIQTAALNRGRHLYSAGWPSRWALAKIFCFEYTCNSIWSCKEDAVVPCQNKIILKNFRPERPQSVDRPKIILFQLGTMSNIILKNFRLFQCFILTWNHILNEIK